MDDMRTAAPGPATATTRRAEAPTRAEQKRAAIIAAAATVFLDNGYVGASMDQVAALAAVSKQTVYKHFADKQELFAELVRDRVRAVSDAVDAETFDLARAADDVETALREVVTRMLVRVVQPDLLRLRRLVIGEAARFPELGRLFYDLGPGRRIAALADAIATLTAAGTLHADDPATAAEQLNWLITGAPLNKAMLLGEDVSLTAAEIDARARATVRVFLAAYGARPA